MKIGILACLYDCEEMLYNVIHPWLSVKEDSKEHEFKIAVVHGLFKENHENGILDGDESTLKLIEGGNWSDFLYVQPPGLYETEAQIRDKGLQYLLKEGCDYIWLLDGDEVYDGNQILNTLEYIESEPFISWFGIEFKNLTFNENTYTTGFCPPRIFRIKSGDFKLNSIYWDNDVSYLDGRMNSVVYKNLSSRVVPLNKCNPVHHTWLNNERSKNKIAYQEAHFKSGAGCSFKWSEEKGLEWNEEYFEKTGQSKPILHTV